MSTRLSLAGFVTRDRLRVYPAIMLSAVVGFAIHDTVAQGLHGDLGGDFMSFYTGGSFVLRGLSGSLGRGDQQHAFQTLVRHYSAEGTALWVSPPFFAWLFAPLAALPFVWAYAVFMTASIALCAASLTALERCLGGSRSIGRLLWLAAQFYPTLHWLIIGQTTGLWLSVLIGVFVSLRRGHDARAGLLFGLLACKPTLALGLAVGLLAARRFRALFYAALSGGALVSIGFLTVPGAMLRYLHAGPKLVAFVRDAGYPGVGLCGSFEFGTLLFDGISPRLGTAFGVLVAAGLFAIIASVWARAPWRPGSAAWDLRMAATLAIGVVASPHLYAYDLMLLLLPFFIVWSRYQQGVAGPFGDRRVLEAAVWVWILPWPTPLLSSAQLFASRWLFGVPMTLQVVSIAVVVWGLLVRRLALRFDEEPRLATFVESRDGIRLEQLP